MNKLIVLGLAVSLLNVGSVETPQVEEETTVQVEETTIKTIECDDNHNKYRFDRIDRVLNVVLLEDKSLEDLNKCKNNYKGMIDIIWNNETKQSETIKLIVEH